MHFRSAVVVLALAAATPAHALTITVMNSADQAGFDSSITSAANASAIEGAIDAAIDTIEGLYSNNVTIPVIFTYDPAGGGDLLSTDQDLFPVSYSSYVSLLGADAAANPQNTVLATAVAHLPDGNDANGASPMALTGAQLSMLTGTSINGDAIININSNQNFSFSTGPTPSGQYDAIGGLEHELDEVMGGGGGGSTLNLCQQDITCSYFGATDLYRYSAPGTPSYSTSGSAYLSINGGVTDIVGFNENPNGDYGDFTPNCAPSGAQYIQDAFSCTGPDEAYTPSSPEYLMLEAIGWDGELLPEPGTLALFGSALLVLAVRRRRA